MKRTFSLISAGVMMAIAVSSCCGTKTDGSTDSCTKTCDSTECNPTARCATPEEIAAIRIPLDMYVNAAMQGDSKVAEPAFAKGATISHAENDTLSCAPIKELFAYYDVTGKQPASYEIADISVAEDVAMVRIESKFGDAEYSDMFTLVKDGSDWKIVAKAFHVK